MLANQGGFMFYTNVKELYEQAIEACEKNGIPESQRHMIACLATKDAMAQTLENLKELSDIIKKGDLCKSK